MFRNSVYAIVILGLAAGGVLFGGDEGEAFLKKIQGTWRFVSQEMDGKAMPKEEVAKLTITFTGDKWTVRDGDKVLQGGTHKFDTSKKHVDAKIAEGEGKGGSMVGIYEMKGGVMKVCFDLAGKERPTSFTSKAGQFSAVVQREKKK